MIKEIKYQAKLKAVEEIFLQIDEKSYKKLNTVDRKYIDSQLAGLKDVAGIMEDHIDNSYYDSNEFVLSLLIDRYKIHYTTVNRHKYFGAAFELNDKYLGLFTRLYGSDYVDWRLDGVDIADIMKLDPLLIVEHTGNLAVLTQTLLDNFDDYFSELSTFLDHPYIKASNWTHSEIFTHLIESPNFDSMYESKFHHHNLVSTLKDINAILDLESKVMPMYLEKLLSNFSERKKDKEVIINYLTHTLKSPKSVEQCQKAIKKASKESTFDPDDMVHFEKLLITLKVGHDAAEKTGKFKI